MAHRTTPGTTRPRCPCCSRAVRLVVCDPPRCARCRNGQCRRCRVPGHVYPKHQGAGHLSDRVLFFGGEALLAGLAERARLRLPLFARRSDRVESG